MLRGVTKRQSIRITQLLAVLQANQIHLPEIESEYPGSPTLRTTTASSVESEEYQAALTAQVAVLHQKLKDHRTTILQLTTSLEQHQRLVKEKGECIADLENESVGIRAQLDTFRGAEGTWIKEKQALSNKLVVYAQRMRVAMQERVSIISCVCIKIKLLIKKSSGPLPKRNKSHAKAVYVRHAISRESRVKDERFRAGSPTSTTTGRSTLVVSLAP